MANNELIKELVTCDGYIYFETSSVRYFHKEGLISHYSDLRAYLTDMNLLHPIAVKVWDSLGLLKTGNDYYKDKDIREVAGWINKGMFTSPNEQGEHVQLATALVEAIRFINKQKNSGQEQTNPANPL